MATQARREPERPVSQRAETGGGSPSNGPCPPLASYSRVRRPAVAEITGAGREWTVSMISELSIPCR